MSRPFAACLLLCLSAPLLAAPPTRVQAGYEVFKDGVKVANMTETFSRQRDHYSIESVSRAVGLLALFKPETIRVTSEGKVTAQGLQPITFVSTRKLDSDRNARADFDWAHDQITLTDRAGSRTEALIPGTQDRLSAMYQFMFLALKDMTELKFDMTNGSKVDHYSYQFTPGQRVTTPFGAAHAIYATSSVEVGSSRSEIWLATDHANFPYKMVVTDPDGSKFTQVLTTLELVP